MAKPFTIYLGSAPSEESCAQTIDPAFREKNLRECRAYKNQILATYGDPPPGVTLRIKSEPHDFGAYSEVVAEIRDADLTEEEAERASDWAFGVEADAEGWLRTWSDAARKELGLDAPKDAPEDEQEDDQTSTSGLDFPGYTRLPDGRWVGNRAVCYENMSVHHLNTLLQRALPRLDDIEDLKDYKWMLLFDPQAAEEKGFLRRYDADHGPVKVLADKFWLTNIDARIRSLGGNPQDLTNNPLVLDMLADRQKQERDSAPRNTGFDLTP
jgi:hypothetical protein